jgi:SRSO17 transposase
VRAQLSGGHAHGAVREPMQWLLIEWPADEPEPPKYWLSTLPADTTLADWVWWAKLRWWVEQNDQPLKDELGLDHFEGRTWAGWHHHVTLTLIAFDFLVLEMLRSKKTSGWTLPQIRRMLQRILVEGLGFCPLCPYTGGYRPGGQFVDT